MLNGKSHHWIAFCILMLGGAGCVLSRPERAQYNPAQDNTLLPVLVAAAECGNPEKATENSGGSFEQALFLELSKRTGGQAVALAELTELHRSRLSTVMQLDGTIDINEVAALGEITNCGSVITVSILEARPYPPQRLVAVLSWVQTDTRSLIRRLHLNIDLREKQQRDNYAKYISGNSGMRLPGSKSFTTMPAVDTGRLSPALFRQYAAIQALDAILTAE